MVLLALSVATAVWFVSAALASLSVFEDSYSLAIKLRTSATAFLFWTAAYHGKSLIYRSLVCNFFQPLLVLFCPHVKLWWFHVWCLCCLHCALSQPFSSLSCWFRTTGEVYPTPLSTHRFNIRFKADCLLHQNSSHPLLMKLGFLL